MNNRIEALALAVSQHYRLLRTIVAGSDGFRFLTDDEARMADWLADIIASLGGKDIGTYCRDHFRTGWMTRDLRSYKIKFVLTRMRDRTTGDIHREFVERLEALTDLAEQMAGCTPDAKRRNKAYREEVARQRKEKAEARSHAPQQMDLFAYAQEKAQESAEKVPVSAETEKQTDPESGATSCEKPKFVGVLFDTTNPYTHRFSKEILDNVSCTAVVARTDDTAEPKAEKASARKPKRKKGETRQSRAQLKYEKMIDELMASEYGTQEDDAFTEAGPPEGVEYAVYEDEENMFEAEDERDI